MRIVYNPKSNLKLMSYGIQIPVTDFRDELIAQALKNDGKLYETIDSDLSTISSTDLTRVHNHDFIERLQSRESLLQEIMSCFELIAPDGTFYRYSPSTATADICELYECVLQKIATVYHAASYCLNKEDAFVLGGGFHHAMSFGGRGFCLLNDAVITLEKLRYENKIKHSWIIDVDAHKGDGSAELTQHNPHISTFSIHMKSSWPLDSGDLNAPWFIPSTLDVEIEKDANHTYLPKLTDGLSTFSKTAPHPDMAIVILGADPYEKDELQSTSHLNLTQEQMLQRDMIVYNFLKDRNIPILYVMGGGYGVHSHIPYIQFLKHILE